MKTEDFEQQIQKRKLTPIEVVTDLHGAVKWFAATDGEQMLLFDRRGFAYSSPYIPGMNDFFLSGPAPKYHGHVMDFEPKQNLIF